MPSSAYQLVHTTMDEIIETSSGGKLTIGLLVAAVVGVSWCRIAHAALNRVYELREGRPWWNTKLQSLILTLSS